MILNPKASQAHTSQQQLATTTSPQVQGPSFFEGSLTTTWISGHVPNAMAISRWAMMICRFFRMLIGRPPCCMHIGTSLVWLYATHWKLEIWSGSIPTCIPTLAAYLIILWPLPFDLGINTCRATALFGVDSSSHFSFSAWDTDTQNQLPLFTGPTHRLQPLCSS